MPCESRGCPPWCVTLRAPGSRRKQVKRSARAPVANGRPMASSHSVDCSGLWDTGSTGECHCLTRAIPGTISTAKQARTTARTRSILRPHQTSAPSRGPPTERVLSTTWLRLLRGHDYALASEYKTQPTPLWTLIAYRTKHDGSDDAVHMALPRAIAIAIVAGPRRRRDLALADRQATIHSCPVTSSGSTLSAGRVRRLRGDTGITPLSAGVAAQVVHDQPRHRRGIIAG